MTVMPANRMHIGIGPFGDSNDALETKCSFMSACIPNQPAWDAVALTAMIAGGSDLSVPDDAVADEDSEDATLRALAPSTKVRAKRARLRVFVASLPIVHEDPYEDDGSDSGSDDDLGRGRTRAATAPAGTATLRKFSVREMVRKSRSLNQEEMDMEQHSDVPAFAPPKRGGGAPRASRRRLPGPPFFGRHMELEAVLSSPLAAGLLLGPPRTSADGSQTARPVYVPRLSDTLEIPREAVKPKSRRCRSECEPGPLPLYPYAMAGKSALAKGLCAVPPHAPSGMLLPGLQLAPGSTAGSRFLNIFGNSLTSDSESPALVSTDERQSLTTDSGSA